MPMVACEGYCGGYVRIRDIHYAQNGEKFCPSCYELLTGDS